MPALWLSGVTKRLGGRDLWAPLELAVEDGETVALLGANGVGKSTLLRIAAAASRPSSGSVVVDGVDAVRRPDEARQRLCLLPQDAPLYAELTPREHLQWWADLHGIQADVDAAAVAAGLAAVANRPAGTLSRGQRQRAALALAALPDPPLLLLDEPDTALDPDGQRCLEGILAARRGRKATLLALHDEAAARRLASRVLRLRRDGVHPA